MFICASTCIPLLFIGLFFVNFDIVSWWMQVARNLGKTLRAFQPTIRELQVPFESIIVKVLTLSPECEVDFILLLFQCRMFLGNSKALWSGRLVSMMIQDNQNIRLNQTKQISLQIHLLPPQRSHKLCLWLTQVSLLACLWKLWNAN